MEKALEQAAFERRIQSIAQAVILALILGCGAALVNLMQSAARQDERNAQVQRDITEIKLQAQKDLGVFMAEIATLRTQTSNAAIAAALAATTAAAAASTAPHR